MGDVLELRGVEVEKGSEQGVGTVGVGSMPMTCLVAFS